MNEHENFCPHCGRANTDIQKTVRTHAGICLVLGIASLFGFPFIFGPLAILFGFAACENYNIHVNKGRDLAVAGIALGLAGFGYWLLGKIGIALTVLTIGCVWAVYAELVRTGKIWYVKVWLGRFGAGIGAWSKTKTDVNAAAATDIENEDVPRED